MSEMLKLRRGIYIDVGCHEIINLSSGWFIPEHTARGSGDNWDAYKKAVEEFRDKWFDKNDYRVIADDYEDLK